MEMRYGRRSEKYGTMRKKRTCTDAVHSKKSHLELRCVCCVLLLVLGIVFSFSADSASRKSIRRVLYRSNTLSEWKSDFMPAVSAAKNGAKKSAAILRRGVEMCEKSLGIKSSNGKNLPVKADSKDKDKSRKPEKAAPKQEESDDSAVQQSTPPEDITQDSAAVPAKSDDVIFRIPTPGEVSSVFGNRVHPLSGKETTHTGTDIAAPAGQTVIAAAPGTVVKTGSDDMNGKYVVIKHNDKITTVYAHLSEICVKTGENTDDNTKIGEVGSTGVSTGPHLHFEVKINGESVNPENYIMLPHRKGV